MPPSTCPLRAYRVDRHAAVHGHHELLHCDLASVDIDLDLCQLGGERRR